MTGELEEQDWYDELEKRDAEGLLANLPAEYVKTKAMDAVAWIDSVVPAAAFRRASGQLTRRTWIKTVTDVVMRVFRNPTGKQSESDGVYSYGVSQTVASGDMWLTKNDLAALNGSDETVPGTFSVGLHGGWG